MGLLDSDARGRARCDLSWIHNHGTVLGMEACKLSLEGGRACADQAVAMVMLLKAFGEAR